ncbi:MAG: peptidylprolyl isomerase [Bacteroidetes bacterium]|nr:peptidylprolyl isomerase [Bacteroidota bacterium]
MAVIQKIRDRYAKLAGGAIAISLVAFILMDGLNGGFDKMFGKDADVAKVDGKGIDGREFSKMSQDYIALSELFRKGQPMTEEEQAQLRQQLFDQMVNEKIMEKECDKLGIVVSPTEEKEMFSGANPEPAIQNFFSVAFGIQQWDPRIVKEFESEVKKTTEPKLQELGQQWESLKTFLLRSRRFQKYTALIAGSAYVPKAIQMLHVKQEQERADIRFVKVPYTSIPDAQVSVSDADMKDYMQRHKEQFTLLAPTRNIEYVAYDVKPDADDTAQALGALEKLRPSFITATNNEAFVNRNSEERYSKAYVTKARYMSPMADTILRGAVGAVFGPFFDNGSYKMVKVTGRKEMPDSVRAKHILIATQSQQNQQGLSDTLAHQRADSLLAALKHGANFDSLATKFSDDPGSKVKGGDLGYFSYGAMVPEFNEFCFDGKVGEDTVLRTQFGWHIVHITDQKAFEPAVQLATVAKSLNIGQKADQAQFAKANEFAGQNRTKDAFDAAIKKNGLDKKLANDIRPQDYIIPGLGASRDIIRWAYAAKLGDVSDPIHLDNRYVVATVTAINEPGLRPLDANLKPQIENLVRVEKKAKMIADKYKGASSLDALAQQAGLSVDHADSVRGNASFAPGIGFEPKLLGYTFYPKFQLNTLSPAIQGGEGVFFVSVTRRSEDTQPMDPQALSMQMKMQDMQLKNMINQTITESLRRHAEIKVKPENIF